MFPILVNILIFFFKLLLKTSLDPIKHTITDTECDRKVIVSGRFKTHGRLKTKNTVTKVLKPLAFRKRRLRRPNVVHTRHI